MTQIWATCGCCKSEFTRLVVGYEVGLLCEDCERDKAVTEERHRCAAIVRSYKDAKDEGDREVVRDNEMLERLAEEIESGNDTNRD